MNNDLISRSELKKAVENLVVGGAFRGIIVANTRGMIYTLSLGDHYPNLTRKAVKKNDK